ncbi:MAG: rhodanese-related sulfurtransferase, partial [Bacteroidales bacterium]
MEQLHNIYSKTELLKIIENEPFNRRTLSFYRYTHIHDPATFRDELYGHWSALKCLGRIYIAHEGINAQMSVPEPNIGKVLHQLEQFPGMNNMPVKWAIEDDSRSFLKLIVRVRAKIVADGLQDDAYDVTDVGKHLTPGEFHELSASKDTLVVDMRNSYEYEIGHFKGAINLESDTFREAMQHALVKLEGQLDKKILLYCTGGIRCEKASSWLRHHGYNDVNQLHGGIIEYARYARETRIPSNFTGKNFVFDNRLGESIDGLVISSCHQCGKPCDSFTNCANDHCHVLFLQCDECAAAHEGCCSAHCHNILHMDNEEKAKL